MKKLLNTLLFWYANAKYYRAKYHYTRKAGSAAGHTRYILNKVA